VERLDHVENGAADYWLVNGPTNFPGNDRADLIVVPKTTASTKCTTFPAMNATLNFQCPLTCD
jgi:hypothetical protein